MELYLIRHGIAEERGSNNNDQERSLTDLGRQKTHLVAARLYQLGLRFDLILTSPLVRSRQTAEILRFCGLSSQLEESSYLAPDGDIHARLRGLLEQQQHLAQSQLALVGHQPDLGQWAEILIWGEAREGLVLKKAGIIGLILPETGSAVGRSWLFWLTPPKFLL